MHATIRRVATRLPSFPWHRLKESADPFVRGQFGRRLVVEPNTQPLVRPVESAQKASCNASHSPMTLVHACMQLIHLSCSTLVGSCG